MTTRTIYDPHRPVVILPEHRAKWRGVSGEPARGFLTRSTRAVNVDGDVTTIVNAPRKERLRNTPKSDRFSAILRQVVTEMSRQKAEAKRQKRTARAAAMEARR